MGKGRKARRASAKRTDGNQATHDRDGLGDLQLDPRGDGMYSGSFRWKETKRFPPLPVGSHGPVELRNGWQGYLASRSDDRCDLVATATSDPSMLDALSFPVTLLYLVKLLELQTFAGDGAAEVKNVLVIGASRKAEQRVFAITDYWGEIARSFPSHRVNLVFIGPEVEQDAVGAQPDARDDKTSLTVVPFRGTFGEFQQSRAFETCNATNTVIIGYNTGFGSFVGENDYQLLLSWLPDLYAIADSGIPAIFTCANDYSDMNGEFAVQSRVVGAEMLLLPQQNPFSAASHLHEEGKQETAWSRASSFLYVIQGYDSSRRIHLDPSDSKVIEKVTARLDADLPGLHLVDRLGRHYFMGMVLTKEQASRCKALNQEKHETSANTKATTPLTRSEQSGTLSTPRYDILAGAHDNEIIVRVHVPDVRLPTSDKIAVDVSESMLTVLVQSKYLLRTKLPFKVDNGAPVRAELAPPFLLVALRRIG